MGVMVGCEINPLFIELSSISANKNVLDCSVREGVMECLTACYVLSLALMFHTLEWDYLRFLPSVLCFSSAPLHAT